jgi:hypothetical protein
MRVRIFSSSGTMWLEKDINDWLQSNEKDVVILSVDPVSVSTSTNGTTYACKILYEFTDQALKEIQEASVDSRD